MFEWFKKIANWFRIKREQVIYEGVMVAPTEGDILEPPTPEPKSEHVPKESNRKIEEEN